MLLAAPCPANAANELATPPPIVSKQLITVEAPNPRATSATTRIWHRVGSCWVLGGGPYTARVGRNGIRADKREGDGATPTGTFPIGRTMYGNSPNPGVLSATCGCISLRRETLIHVLRWLRPSAKPYIAIQ